MLKPERMSELSLLCRSQDAKQVISILADLKALHITDHTKERVGETDIDIGTPYQQAATLSGALVMTRSMLTKLAPANPANLQMSVDDRIERITQISQMYAEHEEELAGIRKDIAHIDAQLTLLDLLPEVPIEAISATRSVESFLLRKTAKSASLKLDPLIMVENDKTVFITIKRGPKDFPGYETIDLAPLAGLKGMPKEAAGKLHYERTTLLHEQEHLTATMQSFNEHTPFLAQSESVLALELLKAQAPLHFGTTKHIMLIRGFIPTKRRQELEQRLTAANINALTEYTAAKEAPVALDNPHATSFESLIKLYTLPRYSEIDPTSLMAITFPIFFGFMLGDIGYGAIALGLFLWIRQHYSGLREFANIFIVSAISTIIFGLIYGEVFGSETFLGLHLTPLIARTESLSLMFAIAICIGLLHINLGLILGMINASEEGWFFAILRKGSWMLLELGLLLMFAGIGWLSQVPIFAYIDGSVTVGLFLIALALAGIWYSDRKEVWGLKGLLEAPMILSNTMSYMRLVALGLASVYLAFVINSVAGGLFVKGSLWIVLGVVILLAGHALNLTLGLLGPFLHSLRLHYVEFFTKFYEGGGRPYRPFGGES